MDWDYKSLPSGYFKVIHASVPCNTFSKLQDAWIGRKRDGKIFTEQNIKTNIEDFGLPLLQRTIEIFLYFQPKYWIIENPATGKMKDYLSVLPQHVVSYCKYANWGYRKPTSIFTNIKGFLPKTCDSATPCKQKEKYGRHQMHLGKSRLDVRDILRQEDRYRVPYKLMRELFDLIN